MRKSFDTDFGEALRVFALLKSNGRTGVTLRSKNIGFPPPPRIVHHEVVTWKVVTRRGKRYRQKVVDYEDLMETTYNPQGIWWCPYCIKLRRFKHVRDWVGRDHMVCPVCTITERDWHVRRWNPQAKVIEYSRRRRRGTRSVRRRTAKR